MKGTFAVSVVWIACPHVLWAQFDMLTPYEALRIVEQTPPVAGAATELHCPVLADVGISPQHPTIIEVEVRCGSFHDYYSVDRRTGSVTLGVVDNPPSVGDQASEALAKQLVEEARSRALSVRDCQCIALEAGRSLPGWNDPRGSISIEPWGTAAVSPETSFELRYKSANRQTENAALLSVDPRTGYVLNGGSAAEVMSPGLGELLAKLIALRSPPLLSDHDALSIALKVPAFATIAQRAGCSLIVSSALTPEQAQIAPSCDGHYLNGPKAAVSLRDGVVVTPDTGKVIDAPDAARLARSLVAAAHEARLHLQEEVNARCAAPEQR